MWSIQYFRVTVVFFWKCVTLVHYIAAAKKGIIVHGGTPCIKGSIDKHQTCRFIEHCSKIKMDYDAPLMSDFLRFSLNPTPVSQQIHFYMIDATSCSLWVYSGHLYVFDSCIYKQYPWCRYPQCLYPWCMYPWYMYPCYIYPWWMLAWVMVSQPVFWC